MPINLALIGCGPIASAHIKAANTLANTELLFATDSDLERARQTAIDHNIPHYSTDYAQEMATAAAAGVQLSIGQSSRCIPAPLTSKPKCYWHKTPSARCSISSTSAPFGSTSFFYRLAPRSIGLRRPLPAPLWQSRHRRPALASR